VECLESRSTPSIVVKIVARGHDSKVRGSRTTAGMAVPIADDEATVCANGRDLFRRPS
jgi:hypothetical protein